MSDAAVSSGTCTIIATPRDRFSTIDKCLQNLLKHTPGAAGIIAVMGGASQSLKDSLLKKYAGSVRFIFTDRFMNSSELRNIGLRQTKTPLAVCLDTDVYVRPGWLEPLLRCQRETGAALVVPLVLDRQNLVHTAGNDFYVTTDKKGVRHGRAELRYAHMYVAGETNLTRRPTDFGEIHCHLVEVETAIRLGVYDERFREGSDMDSGLSWKKAGSTMMFEPQSRVYLYYEDRVHDPGDVALYMWKWDVAATVEGFEYFRQKWGIDMLTHSEMAEHMRRLGGKIGFFSRMYPSNRLAAGVDKFYYQNVKNLGGVKSALASFKNKIKFSRRVP